jgi:hypothetical protein
MPCVFFVKWRWRWMGHIQVEDFKKDFIGKVVDGDSWA